MSKANGSGGDDLQAAFLLDDEEAPAKPNGSGKKEAPAKRGKRIKAEAQPESPPESPPDVSPETPPAEPAAEAVSAPATEPTPPMDAGAEPGSESVEAPEAEPEVQGPRVMRYGNDGDGCWVEYEDGTREPLSEEGWTNALARHFKRETPAAG